MQFPRLILLLIVGTICGQDYYKLLGVNRNADDDTLKKAFKKLSLKYHPDKNKGKEDNSAEKYQEIVNAYEVLRDPEQRPVYDRLGEEGLKEHGQRKQQQNNPHDMFSRFFGHQQGQSNQAQSMFGNTDVMEIDMTSLSRFYRRDNVWIILFYKNDESSKQYKEIWTQLATKYYGIFKVAAINCAAEDAICDDEFQVYEHPAVLAFPANSRQEPTKFNEKIDIDKLAKLAVSLMENFVTLVNTANYQQFIQQELHIVLLFSNKKSTPPLLKMLSKELKGRLIFGQVRDSDEELISKFNINKYPTLMVLTDPQSYLGIVYESNDFKKEAIMRFLREYAYKPKKQQKAYFPPKELNPTTLKNGSCSKVDQNLCVLLITQNQIGLQLLQPLSINYQEDKISFYYVDKSKIIYTNIFNEIDEFPAIVVIKPKKERYTLYSGVKEQEQLINYFDEILGGGIQFQKMNDGLENNLINDEL